MQIIQVDAFADRPFAGNPAGVLVFANANDSRWNDDPWLQDIATEMNLSETAFLRRREDGHYDLRWFTPAVEVELCGHATLASAHVLWTEGHAPLGQEIRFHTLSGVLTAMQLGDASGGGWIDLDFPAEEAVETAPEPGLLEALGIRFPHFVGRNRFDYLIELAEEADVRHLRPNTARLAEVHARGFIVTSRGEDYDFVSRFFAPAAGVAEDPVTGSAHCCLGPYWAAKLGSADLVAYQASRRGGVVRVQCRGDRVGLAGQAVTIFRAELEPIVEALRE